MKPNIIVVGTSAGGLRALEVLFGALPRTFPVPIVAVQHRARESSDTYAEVLSKKASLPVREATDDDSLDAPVVLLAPPDYHVLVAPGHVCLSIDDPVTYSRPSIDVLFESAADAYGPNVLAVLLTGKSADGAKGMARIKEAGGFLIVQEPRTAECPEMPSAAIVRAAVDKILPLEDIAAEIVRRTVS
jgi:two-component system chemotaxis response regulator CheB